MKLRIFCTFGILAHPQIMVFGGFDMLNGEVYQQNPHSHIPASKAVIWRIERQNRLSSATCARDEEPQKRQKKKPHGTEKNGVFANTTHAVQSKYRLAWWVDLWQ